MEYIRGDAVVESLRLQPGSAGNIVYSRLKQQIVSLESPPGTALSEKEVSLSFEVSRTPVRESFVRLAQEDLVVVLPQRGTRVSLIDSELVEEARFMREQLEKAVVRLACESFPEDKLAELEHNLSERRESIEKNDGKHMFELDEAFHRILFEGRRKVGTWNVRADERSSEPEPDVMVVRRSELDQPVRAASGDRGRDFTS